MRRATGYEINSNFVYQQDRIEIKFNRENVYAFFIKKHFSPKFFLENNDRIISSLRNKNGLIWDVRIHKCEKSKQEYIDGYNKNIEKRKNISSLFSNSTHKSCYKCMKKELFYFEIYNNCTASKELYFYGVSFLLRSKDFENEINKKLREFRWLIYSKIHFLYHQDVNSRFQPSNIYDTLVKIVESLDLQLCGSQKSKIMILFEYFNKTNSSIILISSFDYKNTQPQEEKLQIGNPMHTNITSEYIMLLKKTYILIRPIFVAKIMYKRNKSKYCIIHKTNSIKLTNRRNTNDSKIKNNRLHSAPSPILYIFKSKYFLIESSRNDRFLLIADLRLNLFLDNTRKLIEMNQKIKNLVPNSEAEMKETEIKHWKENHLATLQKIGNKNSPKFWDQNFCLAISDKNFLQFLLECHSDLLPNFEKYLYTKYFYNSNQNKKNQQAKLQKKMSIIFVYNLERKNQRIPIETISINIQNNLQIQKMKMFTKFIFVVTKKSSQLFVRRDFKTDLKNLLNIHHRKFNFKISKKYSYRIIFIKKTFYELSQKNMKNNQILKLGNSNKNTLEMCILYRKNLSENQNSLNIIDLQSKKCLQEIKYTFDCNYLFLSSLKIHFILDVLLKINLVVSPIFLLKLYPNILQNNKVYHQKNKQNQSFVNKSKINNTFLNEEFLQKNKIIHNNLCSKHLNNAIFLSKSFSCFEKNEQSFLNSFSLRGGSGNSKNKEENSSKKSSNDEIDSKTSSKNEINSKTLSKDEIGSKALSKKELSSKTLSKNEIDSKTSLNDKIDSKTLSKDEISSKTLSKDEISSQKSLTQRNTKDQSKFLSILKSSSEEEKSNHLEKIKNLDILKVNKDKNTHRDNTNCNIRSQQESFLHLNKELGPLVVNNDQNLQKPSSETVSNKNDAFLTIKTNQNTEKDNPTASRICLDSANKTDVSSSVNLNSDFVPSKILNKQPSFSEQYDFGILQIINIIKRLREKLSSLDKKNEKCWCESSLQIESFSQIFEQYAIICYCLIHHVKKFPFDEKTYFDMIVLESFLLEIVHDKDTKVIDVIKEEILEIANLDTDSIFENDDSSIQWPSLNPILKKGIKKIFTVPKNYQIPEKSLSHLNISEYCVETKNSFENTIMENKKDIDSYPDDADLPSFNSSNNHKIKSPEFNNLSESVKIDRFPSKLTKNVTFDNENKPTYSNNKSFFNSKALNNELNPINNLNSSNGKKQESTNPMNITFNKNNTKDLMVFINNGKGSLDKYKQIMNNKKIKIHCEEVIDSISYKYFKLFILDPSSKYERHLDLLLFVLLKRFEPERFELVKKYCTKSKYTTRMSLIFDLKQNNNIQNKNIEDENLDSLLNYNLLLKKDRDLSESEKFMHFYCQNCTDLDHFLFFNHKNIQNNVDNCTKDHIYSKKYASQSNCVSNDFIRNRKDRDGEILDGDSFNNSTGPENSNVSHFNRKIDYKNLSKENNTCIDKNSNAQKSFGDLTTSRNTPNNFTIKTQSICNFIEKLTVFENSLIIYDNTLNYIVFNHKAYKDIENPNTIKSFDFTNNFVPQKSRENILLDALESSNEDFLDDISLISQEQNKNSLNIDSDFLNNINSLNLQNLKFTPKYQNEKTYLFIHKTRETIGLVQEITKNLIQKHNCDSSVAMCVSKMILFVNSKLRPYQPLENWIKIEHKKILWQENVEKWAINREGNKKLDNLFLSECTKYGKFDEGWLVQKTTGCIVKAVVHCLHALKSTNNTRWIERIIKLFKLSTKNKEACCYLTSDIMNKLSEESIRPRIKESVVRQIISILDKLKLSKDRDIINVLLKGFFTLASNCSDSQVCEMCHANSLDLYERWKKEQGTLSNLKNSFLNTFMSSKKSSSDSTFDSIQYNEKISRSKIINYLLAMCEKSNDCENFNKICQDIQTLNIKLNEDIKKTLMLYHKKCNCGDFEDNSCSDYFKKLLRHCAHNFDHKA